LCEREREREGRPAAYSGFCGLRRLGGPEERRKKRRWAALGWNERREGEKRGLGVSLFFKLLFKLSKI
jgi:hypothetical protein